MQWIRYKRRRPTSVTTHYQAHKEAARALIAARLAHFNTYYGYSFNRVAIRNPRRSWGSCTSLRNLNFSYKLLFLPPCLRDYIIVHELCHLGELNHSPRFWALVAEVLPDYKEHQKRLRKLERVVGGHPVHIAARGQEFCCGQCTQVPVNAAILNAGVATETR